MRLSLLKSGGHLDPRSDAGVHLFRYALLPHEGGFSAESVIRPAWEFNHCGVTCPGVLSGGAQSLVAVDAPNIIVDSVKRAEDGRGLILRLYEAEGTGVRTTLAFGEPLACVESANMLEEAEACILENSDKLEISFSPFDIKTLRLIH